MNAVTVHIPEEIQAKIEEIARSKGTTVDALLGEMTAHAVMEHEGHKLFLEMAERGKGRQEEALALLRK